MGGCGYVGRLAPSPTGALHLGNVRTFMIAWLRARSLGGRVILRIEDLDHPRDKPGAAAAAVEDLRWLGFDWDETFVQSERRELYRRALAALGDRVYPCVCSRADVVRAQSAPHAGEQLFYPGTCRGRFASWAQAAAVRPPCWRFRVPDGTRVAFDDAFAGHFEQDVSRTLGDFPLARDPDGAGYTLAVVVDDLLMGVTEVVRGDDLLPATPAQILVAKALFGSFRGACPQAFCPQSFAQEHGACPQTFGVCPQESCPQDPGACPQENRAACPQENRGASPQESGACPPRYLHVPLVVGADGRRLAKRHGDTRIAAYRAAGVAPERILGFLAASCGWCASDESVALRDLLPRFTLATIPHAPFVVRGRSALQSALKES